MRIRTSQGSNVALVQAKASLFLRRRRNAFTLIEVMVACFVFFTVSFAILALTMQGTMSAKTLQKNTLDFGQAPSIVATNRFLNEGTFTLEFGDVYPDATCSYTVERVNETNDLFRVSFLIAPDSRNSEGAKALTTFYFRPGSPKSGLSAGAGR